ncbi:hypothetical protein PTKIN_Ptkin06aG0039800 [Pterospermum kingtungense]
MVCLGRWSVVIYIIPLEANMGAKVPVVDTIRPNVEHVQDLDDEKPLLSSMLSNNNVKSSVKLTRGGSLLRQKRLRKPTKRSLNLIVSFLNLKMCVREPKDPYRLVIGGSIKGCGPLRR